MADKETDILNVLQIKQKTNETNFDLENPVRDGEWLVKRIKEVLIKTTYMQKHNFLEANFHIDAEKEYLNNIYFHGAIDQAVSAIAFYVTQFHEWMNQEDN